ncbi:hypothetical protein LXM63_04525 [Chryseobacterium gleum]|uniref:hypothetical protein n=1 Tax=Chryseobacterium gleum TaxID=250 RepID=UPI001E4FEFB6|nr:hypothetical protein [Chryseobacterium gleum]MCE4064348.1 hypothetical protein [Chryseobacterium gleum]
MNEYELNGRLMEISLALACEFLELIQVKEQIKKNGLGPDDVMCLKQLGFPGKIEDFEKAVFDFSEKIGFMSSHEINTLGYKTKYLSNRIALKRVQRN